jgi:hypothetical protein
VFFNAKRPVNYDRFRVDPEEYRQEILLYETQPPEVLRQLRAVKICMALLIPLFTALSLCSLPVSLAAGLAAGAACFYTLYKRVSIIPATASLVSIAMGIFFGAFLFHDMFTGIVTRITGGTL